MNHCIRPSVSHHKRRVAGIVSGCLRSAEDADECTQLAEAIETACVAAMKSGDPHNRSQ